VLDAIVLFEQLVVAVLVIDRARYKALKLRRGGRAATGDLRRRRGRDGPGLETGSAARV